MAAMTQTDTTVGNTVFSAGTGGSTGDTLTLIGAGAGKVQAIKSICIYATGTISVFKVLVTKNDGTTYVAAFGGSTTHTPFVFNFHDPIVCYKGDNAVLTFTLTGATGGTVQVGVGYELWAG